MTITSSSSSSSDFQHLLNSHPDSWYYINFDFTLSKRTLSALIPSFNVITPTWGIAFLNSSTVRHISAIPGVRLVENTPSLKHVSPSPHDRYFVHASSSFSKPSREVLPSLFLIETRDLDSLTNDPSVFSISPMKSMKLLNRWTSGLIQSGTQNFGFRPDGKFESTRTLNDRGLTGSGVIVTLLDSGVDVDNPFFYDDDVPFLVDQDNLAHRKVIRYDVAADATDKVNGHGTHAGGTISGSAVCGDALNLYRGHAYDSKLYVVDMAEDIKTDELDISTVFTAMHVAENFGSLIISCSWGTQADDSLFRFLFDGLTLQHQVLFVFATGNGGLPFSIDTPGTAKNVLTVGAATPARGYFTTDAAQQNVSIASGDVSLRVSIANFTDFLETDPIRSYQNLAIATNETEDVRGKLFVVPPDDDPNDFLEVLISREVLAIITYRNLPGSSIPIIVASIDDFPTILQLKTVSINLETTNRDILSLAAYSSMGPTLGGIIKPDVVVPGTAIGSAAPNGTGCSPDESVVFMSGSSMATPAVSGSLALVQQYLNERLHQIPDAPNASNVILRAFAVHATASGAPSQWAGYGVPTLDRVLVFPEDFAERGLRFVDGVLPPEREVVLSVRVQNGSQPLAVTLVWDDDVDIEQDDLLFPVIIDLDLWVISPDKSVVYGNLGREEDAFGTVEKVVLKDALPGIYEIHVRVNPSKSKLSVRYAIVASGGFNHTDFETNPGDLKSEEIMPNIQKCDSLHAGTFCQTEVLELVVEEQYVLTLNAREYKHFHLKPPSGGFQTNLVLESDIRAQQLGILRLFLNVDNKYKLSLPRFLVGLQVESEDIGIDLTELNPSELYFSVFADFWEPITYRIKWKDTQTPETSIWEFAAVPLVICVILIVIIVLGVAVTVWKRRRGGANVLIDELDPRNAVLLEDVQDQPDNIAIPTEEL